MSDFLVEAFDSAIADVESGATPEVDSISKNATIHWGDDADKLVSDETDETSDLTLDDADDEIDDGLDTTTDEVDDATDETVFDFDSVKDKPVKITVNGETFEVPLAELRNGYMRQSDYTRKTQQVAADMDVIQWARTMQNAFRDDPAGSIRYLQEQFGLLDDGADPYEDLDPEIRPIVDELRATKSQLAEMKAWQASQEQAAIQASVQAELAQVQAKYTDFDPKQVLPIAIENGLTMEKAYKLWKVDHQESADQARAAAEAKAEEAATKREQARQAGRKVSKGRSLQASPDDSWKSLDSFEDMFSYELESRK